MDTVEKLGILADAAKYDVACTSSGSDRQAQAGQLGNTVAAGLCHSFTPDGRCISLLKVLFTNVCIHDCAYCVNRASNDVRRASFRPRELADLVIGFYRRNYIEGLFLSSGVAGSADATTERIIECLEILRFEHGFRGYIHAKAIPGTSPDLLDRLGRLCDRMSVNLELPSSQSLALLAPGKSRAGILEPMRQIRDRMAEDHDTRGLVRKRVHYLKQVEAPRKERAFAPAGQSTQMIVGATPESDLQILSLSQALYAQIGLKRVFFSAYLPVNDDVRLPSGAGVQLDREHRLYQADWLMRFYGFDADEIVDTDRPFLDPGIDPKADWALRNLGRFPIEVNRATKRELLRVPGIGVKGAQVILRARKHHSLDEAALAKMGIALNRARFFLTCNGKYLGAGVRLTPEDLRPYLRGTIDGGRHGRRANRVPEGQMSLFEPEVLDVKPAHVAVGGAQLAAPPLPAGTPVGAAATAHAAVETGTATTVERLWEGAA
ncbi:MAG: putative DNA modification/repair radical SAM protein [Coriobacteriaceae bacterium]|nr:putative DNA modification/repair radical SAM protein [Coriobacteriaceae bacterium]